MLMQSAACFYADAADFLFCIVKTHEAHGTKEDRMNAAVLPA